MRLFYPANEQPVEQFYDFAAELADQYLVMSRGEIIQQGRGETMAAQNVRGMVAI